MRKKFEREKLVESLDADHVVEHVCTKTDCNDSEGTSSEQHKENGQLNAVEEIADPTPEIPRRAMIKCRKEEDSRMMSAEDICKKNLVLTARREQIEWVHSEGV